MVVVLLGASKFPKSHGRFGSMASFKRSAQEFRAYVERADGLSIPPERMLDLFDDDRLPNPQCLEIGDFLDRHPTSTDVLIYYVGHGGFGRNEQDYFLALRATRTDAEYATALRVADLADTVRRRTRGMRLYVVLDCCFAGAAVKHFMSASPALELALRRATTAFPASGTALLVAASSDDVAKAPADAEFTAFSGQLLEALRSGIPGMPARLSLRDLGEHIELALREQCADVARPEVHVPGQAKGDIADVPVFPNPAFLELTQEEKDVVQRPQPVTRTLDRALRPTEASRGGAAKRFRALLVTTLLTACVMVGVYASRQVATRSARHPTDPQPSSVAGAGQIAQEAGAEMPTSADEHRRLCLDAAGDSVERVVTCCRRAYYGDNDYELAVRACEHARELDPIGRERPWTFLPLIAAYLWLDRTRDAEAAATDLVRYLRRPEERLQPPFDLMDPFSEAEFRRGAVPPAHSAWWRALSARARESRQPPRDDREWQRMLDEIGDDEELLIEMCRTAFRTGFDMWVVSSAERAGRDWYGCAVELMASLLRMGRSESADARRDAVIDELRRPNGYFDRRTFAGPLHEGLARQIEANAQRLPARWRTWWARMSTQVQRILVEPPRVECETAGGVVASAAGATLIGTCEISGRGSVRVEGRAAVRASSQPCGRWDISDWRISVFPSGNHQAPALATSRVLPSSWVVTGARYTVEWITDGFEFEGDVDVVFVAGRSECLDVGAATDVRFPNRWRMQRSDAPIPAHGASR